MLLLVAFGAQAIINAAPSFFSGDVLSPTEEQFNSKHKCGTSIIPVEFKTTTGTVSLIKPTPLTAAAKKSWDELKIELLRSHGLPQYSVSCRANNAIISFKTYDGKISGKTVSFVVYTSNGRFVDYQSHAE